MASATWFPITRADVSTLLPIAECSTWQHYTEFLICTNLKGTSQVPGSMVINLDQLYHEEVTWLYNFSGINEYLRYRFAFSACSTSVTTIICDLTKNASPTVLKFHTMLLLIKGLTLKPKVW